MMNSGFIFVFSSDDDIIFEDFARLRLKGETEWEELINNE